MTAYDFDRAVKTLGQVIDIRRRETVTDWETPPKPPVVGQVQVQVPRSKYTMRELLYEPPTDDEMAAGDEVDLLDDSIFAHLPAALL